MWQRQGQVLLRCPGEPKTRTARASPLHNSCEATFPLWIDVDDTPLQLKKGWKERRKLSIQQEEEEGVYSI